MLKDSLIELVIEINEYLTEEQLRNILAHACMDSISEIEYSEDASYAELMQLAEVHRDAVNHSYNLLTRINDILEMDTDIIRSMTIEQLNHLVFILKDTLDSKACEMEEDAESGYETMQKVCNNRNVDFDELNLECIHTDLNCDKLSKESLLAINAMHYYQGKLTQCQPPNMKLEILCARIDNLYKSAIHEHCKTTINIKPERGINL